MRKIILSSCIAFCSLLAGAYAEQPATITLINQLPYSMTFMDKAHAEMIPQLDGKEITLLPNSRITLILNKEQNVETYIGALGTYDDLNAQRGQTALFEAINTASGLKIDSLIASGLSYTPYQKSNMDVDIVYCTNESFQQNHGCPDI
jgi:hypothetical protein